MLIPQRTAWGRPLSPASGASAAQSILDVCSARDLAPVPHAPWRRFQGPGVSPILADTRSVSLCRCGESGPQVHPAGSLQPVHQVQELGVTADVETTAGTCAPPSGEALGGPPRGGRPPPPPPLLAPSPGRCSNLLSNQKCWGLHLGTCRGPSFTWAPAGAESAAGGLDGTRGKNKPVGGEGPPGPGKACRPRPVLAESPPGLSLEARPF